MSLEEEYKKYQGENYDAINGMYDAQKQSALANLENAYNLNLSNAQAARDALPATYQAQANDLATQYERNRRNLNQQAAANGINTGTASQQQLALNSAWLKNFGGVKTAEANAIKDADRGINDLKTAYQNSVSQAVADNDYQRAQALLAEYKNQYNQRLQQAQTLASYGDFSAYLNIPGYSQGQVDSMRNTWIAQNPGLAYNTGAITAQQYYQMTGKWPAGYQKPAAGTPAPAVDPNKDKDKDKDKDKENGDTTDGETAATTAPDTAAAGGPVSGNGDWMDNLAGRVGSDYARLTAEGANGNPLLYWIGSNGLSGLGASANNTSAEAYLQQQVAAGNLTPEQAEQIRRSGGN